MRFVISLVFTATVLSAQSFTLGPILLEDFSGTSIRQNTDTPPDDLWAPYNGIDSGNQTYGLSAGTYRQVGFTSQGDGYIWYMNFFPYPYSGPSGFLQYWVRSGTWNTGANRLRMMIKCDKSLNGTADGGGGNLDMGTYVKQHGDVQPAYQGQHYYHQTSPAFYAGRWVLFEFNRVPSHKVGDDPNTNYPDDPEWVNPTTGAPVHYYDGMTRFYIAMYPPTPPTLPVTCNVANVYLDTDTSGEPDTYVSNITATHTGTKYELTWNTPKQTTVTYTIHYSTASMKVNGFASGTNGGTVTNPGSAYNTTSWDSPTMSESPTGEYVAIQPTSATTSFSEIFIPPMDLSQGTTIRGTLAGKLVLSGKINR
ncbi:MAG TPA: hypothetical protein VN633_08355 [Bryobacteraceae bacterium]|nr:hypothetical protein [Bryobacteraceae bacterium]